MKKGNVKKRVPVLTNTRKAVRKRKRQEKKIHRKNHYLKKNNKEEQPANGPGRFVKRIVDDPVTDTAIKNKKKKPEQEEDIIMRERRKEMKEANRLKSEMESQRHKILVEANEEEDKIIKKLEKQLGLNKSKNKNNFFADDGLDYLLQICDRSTTEQIVAAEKHLAEVENESDFEDDLATVTGKDVDKKKKKTNKKDKPILDDSDDDELSESDQDMHEDSDHDQSNQDMSDDSGSENDDRIQDEDMSDMDDDDEMNDEDDDEPEEKPTKTSKSAKTKTYSKIKAKPEKQTKTSYKKERVVSAADLSTVFSDDEVSHLSGDDDLKGFSEDEMGSENGEQLKKDKEKPDVWEDIYGRKRDKEGNIIKEEKGVYIPPHLRNKDSTSDKELQQLKRQIKSVLNKLAGTNLHWACTSIESLYASHSRHSVNSTLSSLWLEALVCRSLTPERMFAEHAALVHVLHANVATEVGAHFLEELCARFNDLRQTAPPVEDKHLDNVVSCLAHLYTFKIYQASLLYDVLRHLLESISEKSIDCVLIVLRVVGGVLRKEEPLALKQFILDTQAKVAKLNEKVADGSRVKFLLEVLMAVKNNNLTKIPNYDPSYIEQLKKNIKTVVRKGNYVTPLNIGLEDLLKADERGKWWIVGSAWEGNRPREEKPTVQPVANVDDKLLALAKLLRMNTDVRRSVFCVIMSATDYMDAFEKLQHLGLKGSQEREIVHVLLACCLQEAAFNPYYAVLAGKLCDFDRKYQLSLQFAVWDKLKELSSQTKLASSNLAKLLTHLIMEKALPLSVLKVIEFSDLNKHSVKFMRQILLAIIMNADLQASLEVFHRISKSPKLRLFKESLRLFIQHFLIKNAGKKNSVLSDSEMTVLKQRTVEVDRILTMHESKLKF